MFDGADSLPNLDALVTQIDGAARVAIVVGKGAMWQSVSDAVVRLAERIGAPVAHTWDGHAAMPTVHPLSIGIWWGAARSHPAAQTVVDEADLVLGVGVRARTGGIGLAGGKAPVLLLDAADQPSSVGGPAIRSVGQLAAVVEALAMPAARAAPIRRHWMRVPRPATFSSAASTSSLHGIGIPDPGTSGRRSTRWPVV